MNFENFNTRVLAIKTNHENKSKAYDFGIDLLEYGEGMEYIICGQFSFVLSCVISVLV